MPTDHHIDLIQEVMGASHIFCSAVQDLLERTLGEATDKLLVMSQVKLLLLVSRPEHQFRVSDVADFLEVSNAAASRAIDRLVQRGLIDRTVSPEDRRAVVLDLTPEGRDLLERFREARNRELKQLLGSVSDSDLRTATKLLDRLSVRLLGPEIEAEDRCLRCGVHFRSGCVVQDILGRKCTVSSALFGEGGEEGKAVAGG
jgi:DNA-binding MarR family transcriptional regulator